VLEIYVKYSDVSGYDECHEFYTDISVYSFLPILEFPRIKACTVPRGIIIIVVVVEFKKLLLLLSCVLHAACQ
jgi:hypothetical protein